MDYYDDQQFPPSTNPTTLPIEVLELIVDEIAFDAHGQGSSIKALRTLALVSVALCRRAYKHLFSELGLNLADNISDNSGSCRYTSENVVSRLYDVLYQSLQFPGIGMVYYIRAVQISLVFSTNVSTLQAVTTSPELLGILDCLHGVHHGITCLKFDVDLTHTTQRIKFPIRISKTTNPQLSNALVSLCASPRFTTLHLTNAAVDYKSLCGTKIQNLYLDNISFEDSEDATQSTAHSLKAILQPISMSLLNIDNRKPNTVIPTDMFSDLVSFLHPSPNITDKSLALSQVFTRLTHLILQDRDRTTPINLLPQLQTLKILQTIYLTRRHMSYTTALPQFFVPMGPGSSPRDLGSVELLVIDTPIPDPRLFFCAEDEDEPRLEDAWGAVDAHLTNALVGTSASGATALRHVQFNFFLRTNQGCGYPYPYNTHQLSLFQAGRVVDDRGIGAVDTVIPGIESFLMIKFMAEKERFMNKFFPQLSSSAMSTVFSSGVSVHRDEAHKGGQCTVVRCKGSEVGWW